ncbi:hypothetical protein BG17_360 [Burkholderia pseudomallei MSHR491]|nr:hypothetical protein BG17_360 [Burkholderia pseudomallei MSHR491]
MHPARPTPPFARASRALAARTMRESAARCSAPRTARRSARRRARMRGRAPRPRARSASGVRRAHRRSARAPSTRAPRHGVARKRDEHRAEVRGARLGQRAGAGRGRALGGGEQIGAHRVRERARRDAGRGARLLEERHVAGGGAQAGDHGGPRSTNGQRDSKRPRAPAPEANARGERRIVPPFVARPATMDERSAATRQIPRDYRVINKSY